MILEVADIRVAEERSTDFEEAVHRGVDTLISRSKGFEGYRLQQCIETPGRYLLMIEWESLEDHTVGFRTSASYGGWRAIVGGFFLQPPHVEHFRLASSSGRAARAG